jgi:hypothetical protein
MLWLSALLCEVLQIYNHTGLVWDGPQQEHGTLVAAQFLFKNRLESLQRTVFNSYDLTISIWTWRLYYIAIIKPRFDRVDRLIVHRGRGTPECDNPLHSGGIIYRSVMSVRVKPSKEVAREEGGNDRSTSSSNYLILLEPGAEGIHAQLP